jgi:hypothetical protein
LGIETLPGLRFVGAMNPVAINLAYFSARKVSMPDLIRFFRKRDA